MDKNVLWSLRLGFSGAQARQIKKAGIEEFLEQSFAAGWDKSMGEIVSKGPRTPLEVKALSASLKGDAEARRKNSEDEIEVNLALKEWWIDRMREAELPLREKMTLFWHNHYVTTFKKCRVNYWLYSQNMLLRENAFGNFRKLTKKVLYSNAMIKYLDNNTNVAGSYNENLSRELLELFTLGIGNYSESDIKNGARGLAGLTMGNVQGYYKKEKQNNEPFAYLGKTGNFKVEEMVNTIFEQPNAPYLITRKILKWFIYDDPDEKLVKQYGDYLRDCDYEMEPFLKKIFTTEFTKAAGGSKIKDPLLYVLQLVDELSITQVGSKAIELFIRQQGMNLFGQPNVKGWEGGNYWLGSGLYVKRHTVADLFCAGQGISPGDKKLNGTSRNIGIHLEWPRKGTGRQIISELKDRLLFDTDEVLDKAFERQLAHDFDPDAPGADNAVVRLFNTMVKTPEFQII